MRYELLRTTRAQRDCHSVRDLVDAALQPPTRLCVKHNLLGVRSGHDLQSRRCAGAATRTLTARRLQNNPGAPCDDGWGARGQMDERPAHCVRPARMDKAAAGGLEPHAPLVRPHHQRCSMATHQRLRRGLHPGNGVWGVQQRGLSARCEREGELRQLAASHVAAHPPRNHTHAYLPCVAAAVAAA